MWSKFGLIKAAELRFPSRIRGIEVVGHRTVDLLYAVYQGQIWAWLARSRVLHPDTCRTTTARYSRADILAAAAAAALTRREVLSDEG